MEETENRQEVETEISAEPEIEIVDEVPEEEESVLHQQEPEQEAPTERAPIVDEDEQRQKKHISLKTAFNQTRREAARIANENETLKQELARLQKVNFQSEDAAFLHYAKSLDLQIQQAKTEKRTALENGDLDAQLAADQKLAEAVAQKTRNVEWKQHHDTLKERQQVQQEQQQQAQQQENVEVAQDAPPDLIDWVERNSWFLPNSPDYNPEVAQEVQSYSEVLERQYRRDNMEDNIYSEQYFTDIDNYIKEQILGQKPEPARQSAPRTQINMKPVRQNVAPVSKGTRTGEGTPRKTVTLSSQEKEFAKIMNLSDQDYAKWKIKDQERQVAKGFGPMGRQRF